MKNTTVLLITNIVLVLMLLVLYAVAEAGGCVGVGAIK